MGGIHGIQFEGLAESSLDAFLGFLYEGLQGYVIVGELQSNGNKSWMEHSAYMWPDERSDIKSHIAIRGQAEEVYLTPAVFSTPEPRKESFKASNVIWCEYDSGVPDNVNPSLRVQSSPGKEHHYYRMIQSITDITELETTNRAIAYKTNADKSGWDAVQFLRPVGSYNHKYDIPHRVVTYEYVGTEHAKGVLDEGYRGDVPVREGSLENGSIPLGILPSTADTVFKYPFPFEVQELYRLGEPPTKADGTSRRSEALLALANMFADMGMTNEEMYVMLESKDKVWKKYFDRPDKKERYLALIQKARSRPPKDEGETSQNYSEAPLPGREIPIFGWSSLVALEVQTSWIAKNMWHEDTANVIVAKEGLGKTQITMRLGMALALGHDKFLDWELTRQRKCLFMSLELNTVGIKIFQDIMNETLNDKEREVLEEYFKVVPLGEPLDLTTPWGQEALDYILEETQAKVLLLDSMGSAVPGGLSKEEPIAAFLRYNDILNNRGISTWYISHPRKTEAVGAKPRRPTSDDLYGGSFQKNRARGILGLHQEPGDDSIELEVLKQSFAPKDHRYRILERTEDLNFKLDKLVLPSQQKTSGGLKTTPSNKSPMETI